MSRSPPTDVPYSPLQGRGCRRGAVTAAPAAVMGLSPRWEVARVQDRPQNRGTGGGSPKRSAWPGGYSCTARKVDCESVMSKNPQLAIMDLAHDDHWRIPLWMKGGHLQPSPYRRFHAREPHTLAAYPAHPPAHELSRITRARRSSRRARYTARRHIQIAAPPRRWPAQVETRRRAARARRGERFVNGGL